MMRYLLSGAAVAAPVLVCMAVVIYLFSPSSDVLGTQPGQTPASATPRYDGSAFSRPQESGEVRDASPVSPPAIARVSASAISRENTEETSPAEQAAQWEELAIAETSDLQTRAESLVNLTQVNAARGEYVLGAMIASEQVDDRHLAVALLRDWRNRTGDSDGRIAALLQQAANDADAGVAYQARTALEPVDDYSQADIAAYSADIGATYTDSGSD